jgi:hypothetical protein
MAVQDGIWRYNELYRDTGKEVREGTRQYILVHTSMYCLVLHGAMWYKEVHGGTGWPEAGAERDLCRRSDIKRQVHRQDYVQC